MIKLHACVSKKRPINGQDYSSRSFSASVEVEVASTDEGRIQEHLDRLYRLLDEAVERQFSESHPGNGQPVQTPTPAQAPTTGQTGNQTNHDGQQPRRLSDAQLRAIHGIARSLGLDENGGLQEFLAPFRVDSPGQLTVREASQVIDKMKRLQDEPRTTQHSGSRQ